MRQFGKPIVTKETVVKCDGGGGPLGHPAIFLNLMAHNEIVCPYCSQSFVKKREFKEASSNKKKRKGS